MAPGLPHPFLFLENPGEASVTSLREGMGALLWKTVRAKPVRCQTQEEVDMERCPQPPSRDADEGARGWTGCCKWQLPLALWATRKGL